MAGGFIYFAVCDALGTVKIGYTSDPKSRLNGIQNGCPFPVRYAAIIPGTRTEERLIQKTLAAYQIMREWFWLTDQVLGVINDAKERNVEEEELEEVATKKRPDTLRRSNESRSRQKK